jgi:hemerythrin
MTNQKGFIPWDAYLDLGVPLMDDDHKKMVALMNDLCSALANHHWDNSVKHAMLDLAIFTVQHFNREEQLMLALNYPALRAHAKAHRFLIEILDAITVLIDRDGPAGIDDSMIEFLHKWLVNHIHKSDQKLANYYHTKTLDTAVSPMSKISNGPPLL